MESAVGKQKYARVPGKTEKSECAFHIPGICMSDSFDGDYEVPNLEKLIEIPCFRIILDNCDRVDLFLCGPCLGRVGANWEEVEIGE